jgi:hypothetical protein
MVLDYIIYLKKIAKPSSGKARRGELSVNSIKMYLAGIQSFLEFNDIVLNWKKIAKYCPEQIANNLRAYTKEEISKLLSVGDLLSIFRLANYGLPKRRPGRYVKYVEMPIVLTIYSK